MKALCTWAKGSDVTLETKLHFAEFTSEEAKALGIQLIQAAGAARVLERGLFDVSESNIKEKN